MQLYINFDTSMFSRQVFCGRRPGPWNSLPVHPIQTDIDFEQFTRLLKTFFVLLLKRQQTVTGG